MNLDLKGMIYFAHIARTRSFSASAAQLGVAQPWLSARIRRIEARLGTALFERTTRRVALTSEGERLLPAAELLALAAGTVETAAAELSSGDAGRLRIGSPPFASRSMRRIDLMEYFAGRTGVTIEMDIGWTGRLLDRLKRGDLDAAFIIEPFETTGLQSLRLCSMVSVLFARDTDAGAGRPALSPAELPGRRIGTFVRALNPGLFDLLYAPLREAGAIIVEVPEVRRSMLGASDWHDLDMLGTIEPAPFAERTEARGVVKLRLDGVPLPDLLLVRRIAANTQTCDRFWETAEAHLAGEEGQ